MSQAIRASVPVDGEDRLGVPEQFGGMLLAQQTIDDLLQLIVTSAGSYFVETYGASVTAVRETGFETPNASSPAVRSLDASQYETNDGPSVIATMTGEEVNFGLDVVMSRWPALADAMDRRELGGVLSMPLFAHGRSLGTLNVYLDTAGPAEEPLVGLVRALARQASALLSRGVDLEAHRRHHDALVDALQTRELVGQAEGMLMVSRDVTADQAFDILRVAAEQSGETLREVAQRVVDRRAGPPASP